MMSGTVSVELPRAPSAAAHARAVLTERFGAELSEEELDTVKLLASELVTNAVVHGEGTIRFIAEAGADRVRVEVVDDGSGFVHLAREVGAEAVSGRGLSIVAAESSRWGMFEGTTHVWFEVPRAADLEPSDVGA